MAKLKAQLQKIDGKPLTMAKSERAKYDEYDKNASDGSHTMTLSKSVKPKSRDQLGAIFGLLISSTIEQANNEGHDTSSFLKELVRDDLPTGVGLTTGFLKELFYVLCPMSRDGKRITLSKASTVEAAKWFDDCRNLLANHGIIIDDPNPNWRNEK